MKRKHGEASARLLAALEALSDPEVTVVLRAVIQGAKLSGAEKNDELRLALKLLHETHAQTKKSERTLQRRCGILTRRVADLERRARFHDQAEAVE